MSITVVQDKGVTVINLEMDRTSKLPLLCQILKTLCCSMQSCSLFRRANGLMESNTVSALGSIQIMVGLFNIGLGPGRISLHPEDFVHLGVAYWLGGVFIVSGIVSLLANRFPCLFSVGFAVLMNIIGSIFSSIGIRRYALDTADISTFQFCDEDNLHRNYCGNVARLYRRLVIGMDISMIVLTVLQLIVCITVTVLGIRVLFYLRNKEDARHDQPEMKEALLTGPVT
ncbi:uncharacterized protein LOC131977039 isoform X2 [Centropristis striata]|uniref:uncharacterized protein LOC131977039 isoform X2 n=1 Tax=Centropristis striata TaxID=184440 RepID=UPI0027DF973E|nr:uncharacterized protein LOC131977039 isoform X2 [Centropristis striata]